MSKLHPVLASLPPSAISQYQKDALGYPSDDVHPDEKNTSEWCMQFAKALYAQFVNGRLDVPFDFAEHRPDYRTLRLYADGNEPIDKIKNKLTIKSPKDPNAMDTRRMAYTSISWDNESPFPRYVETLKGIMQEMRGNTTIRAVDQASFEGRERLKWSIWEQTRNPFYKRLQEQTGKQFMDDVPFVPADLHELETYEAMAMELQHEEAMKIATDRCFELSGWDVLSDMLKSDLIALGFIGTRAYFDRATKKPLAEYIDPERALLPKSKYPDYRDADVFGHIGYITIHELRRRMRKQNAYKKEEEFIEKIKKHYNAQLANFVGSGPFENREDKSTLDRHGFNYDNFEVAVVFCERRSWNTHVYSTRMTKNGEQTYVEDFDYELSESDKKRGVKVDRKTYEMWYRCAWVIGTDMCFDWGPNEYVIRDKKGRAYSNYSFYRMTNKSMTESAIPKLDRITLACKKFQIAWANAAPNGFMINWAALQGISYGGKALTEKEVVKVYLDTGKLFVNVDPNNPKKAVGFIIQQLPGGLGNILNEFVGTYNATIQELNDITGVTQPLLGAAPVSNQLNGVTEMAQQSAMSRLKPIMNAIQHIRKATCRAFISNIMAQAMFEDEFEDQWYDFNKGIQRKIRIPAEFGKYNYEISVDEDYSPLLRQEILTTARESASRSAQGDPTQLTYSDYLLIVEFVERGKLRWARHLMERRLAKRAALAQMQNIQNIEANAQTQAQSLQKQMEVSAALKQQETEAQIAVDDNKSANKKSEIQEQGRVDIIVDKATEGDKGEKKSPPAQKKSTEKK